MNQQRNRPFDIIYCSKEIRRLIIERIKKLHVSQYLLCQTLKINKLHFEAYLNIFNPLWVKIGTSSKIRQEDILKVANALGIEVSIMLSLKELKDVDVTKFQSENITKIIKNKKKLSDEKIKKFFE